MREEVRFTLFSTCYRHKSTSRRTQTRARTVLGESTLMQSPEHTPIFRSPLLVLKVGPLLLGNCRLDTSFALTYTRNDAMYSTKAREKNGAQGLIYDGEM